MEYIELQDRCYLYHSQIIEIICSVISVFCDEENMKKHGIYFHKETLEYIQKHKFLGEILKGLKFNGLEILEFMFNHREHKEKVDKLQLPIYDFQSLDDYEQYLLSLKPEEFFYIFYSATMKEDSIKAALQEPDMLLELFYQYDNTNKSFSGFKMLIDNREIFIRDLFRCARVVSDDLPEIVVNNTRDMINGNITKLAALLKRHEPLEVSQCIMGKTFFNRGPYNEFIFMPSMFLPRNAIRFFYDYQILIYSIDLSEMSKEEIINTLKVLSDESRFNILELLSTEGPMIGKTLASRLNIATSTLSHHMEMLGEVGFIHQERVKNSKYYSIDVNSVNRFINRLNEIFKNTKIQ